MEDTIVREMKEEYGVDIEIVDLLGVCNHVIPQEQQHWVSSTFICKIANGTPKILEFHKCEQIGWFFLKNLLLCPYPLLHSIM